MRHDKSRQVLPQRGHHVLRVEAIAPRIAQSDYGKARPEGEGYFVFKHLDASVLLEDAAAVVVVVLWCCGGRFG